MSVNFVADEPVIRLDTSKPFSECRGERTPDDPHYRVHFWQGGRVGKDIVLLPFDSQHVLVPDDGKKESWEGKDADGKLVMHYPLYNQLMRDMVERKKKRLAGGKAAEPAEAAVPDVDDEDAEERAGDDVNFVSWLRGEAQYQPHVLRAAAKKRYSKNYAKISELVTDLVLDEQLVPEDQVHQSLRRHLPGKAA